MSNNVTIGIQTSFQDAGIQAAQRELARLVSAQQQASRATQAGGAAATSAERELLRYASALARSQMSAGNAADGVQTLRTALEQVNLSSVEAQRALTQLSNAEARLSGAKGPTVLPRTIAGLSHEALDAAKAMIGLGSAIEVVSRVGASFADAFRAKAELDASRQAITTLLGVTRDSGQVFNEAAAFANRYAFTQREITAAVQASVPIMRLSKASTEDVLGALARLAVLNPAEGIEGAAFALRELASGDVTSLVERFNLSRDSAYQMRDAIQNGGDAIQVLSSFLDTAGVSMQVLEDRTKGAAGAMREVAKAQEDLAMAQAEWASGPGLTILQTQADATRGLARVLSGELGAALDSAAAKTDTFSSSLVFAITGFTQNASVIQMTRDALFGHAEAADASTQAITQTTAATMQYSNAAIQATSAGQTEAEMFRLIDQAAREQAAAVEQSGISAMIASSQAALLAQRQNELHDAALAAVKGTGDLGVAAAVLADRFNLPIAQVQILLGLLNQLDSKSISKGSGFGRNYAKGPTRAHAKPTDDAMRAAMGLPTGSEQIRVQRAYEQSEHQRTARSRGRGRAAGAAKLSDQQKLNNQLLSEQDKAQNRLEEAAENHYQKLLDIEKDYAEKSLVQQRQNEVSKRQSRADFYDSLTSSTKDIGGAEAQRISAEYEAAYQKSQEIAQAGNAKLAADYLALKEQQLEAETQYQQARAQAIKESQEADDKEARKAAAAEAERLDRVRELQRQAEAEEEKQLLEGGDANAQARAKAIEEENARYQQQQADIIQSSDQATAAKIANAERAGKAIDRENLALERQAQLYSQIGAAQGVVPAAPPGATAASATAAPGSVPVLDVGSLIAAIEAQTGALSGKLDGVIGAVGAVERAISSAQHVPIGG